MKKIHKIISTAALSMAGLVACQSNQSADYRQIEGFAQGTTYNIIYSDTTDYAPLIAQFLDDFDASLSIFDSTSLVCQINDGLTDSVDAWYAECFAISKQIHQLSAGLFDPTLAPLIAAYGFARKNDQKTVDSVEVARIMSSVGFDKVDIVDGLFIRQNADTKLDFNAIAQGYSSDLVARMLDSLKVENYMVEIGGEIVTRGVSPSGKAWRIGIDSPQDGNFIAGASLSTIIELDGRALATSGNYRKYLELPNGERVNHTIDPRTGRSASNNLLSATILAPTAAMADGLATACMVGGLEWAKKMIAENPDVDGYLIYADKNGDMKSYSTL